jgi:Fe-Mn family superoxide dismutase
MCYTAKNYQKLIGIAGFSETALKNHFTLYEGYVTNTNKIIDTLEKMLKEDRTGTIEYSELKRRFGWEWNGMRLHELYFENLGTGGSLETGGKLAAKLASSFGSYESWERDFRATGAMRGIGWVMLYQDITSGRLFNTWINEHDTGHPTGWAPILVMDCFEHAYLTDYGIKRAD